MKRILFEIKRLMKKIEVIPQEEENRYAKLFILAGYIFLGVTIIDYIFILFPLQLFNPLWEFQVLEKLVENAWSSILAGIFLFYPHKFPVIRIEKIILTWLSNFFLVLGIVYLLMSPLIIGDAYRIGYQRDIQLENKIAEQNKELSGIKAKLNQANLQQLNNFIQNNPSLKLKENTTALPKIREQLTYQIEVSQKAIINQEKSQVRELNSFTKKIGIKLVMKTILVGILLIGIWHYSAWTRKSF